MDEEKTSGFKKQLGINIQRRRQEVHMTQEFLAERAEISFGYIKKIEQGQGMPKIHVLKNIAEVLGTSTDDLLQFEKSNEPQSKDLNILHSYYLRLTPSGREALLSIAKHILELEKKLKS